MPIYEYQCSVCNRETEKLTKYDAPPPQCAQCQEAMKKLVSRSSFALKGGGWYRDGYGLHQGKEASP